jgi:hypothetical protein
MNFKVGRAAGCAEASDRSSSVDPLWRRFEPRAGGLESRRREPGGRQTPSPGRQPGDKPPHPRSPAGAADFFRRVSLGFCRPWRGSWSFFTSSPQGSRPVSCTSWVARHTPQTTTRLALLGRDLTSPGCQPREQTVSYLPSPEGPAQPPGMRSGHQSGHSGRSHPDKT